ncbi:MAG TPA: hypothetical protein VI688_00815, partial [Anaerolineales bacterium]|nr:hypothetical protein [Anaerolineales bacterium]
MKLDERLLRLIEPTRFAFGLTIGLGFAGAVLVVMQARLLSSVITQVFLNHTPLAGVTSLLGALVLVFLLRAGAILGGEVAGNQLAVKIKSGLRARLFRRLQAAGPIHFKGNDREREQRTGELANTAIEGVEAPDAYFSQYLPQIVL